MTEINTMIGQDLLKTIISSMLKVEEESIKSIEAYNSPFRKDTSFIVTRQWDVEGKTFQQVSEVAIKVVPLVQGPKECLTNE